MWNGLDETVAYGSSAGMSDERTALVLFSGGQDSTVCLAYALATYDRVETLAFDYGQTHKVELDCRHKIRAEMGTINPDWAARLGDDHMLTLPALADIGGTALIGDGEIRMMENGLPSTFVPGRNVLFLTYGGALAYRRGLHTLVGGMCETDFSGYPDCRRETLDALETTLQKAMESDVNIDTPLMYTDKMGTWKVAHELGGAALTELIIEHSHTCYRGDRDQRHAWGYGCNDCPACDLRRIGYNKWKQTP